MNKLIDKYNAVIGGTITLLSVVLGQYWYLFVAFLFFNVMDWITGWYKAWTLKKENSKTGLKGIIKKVGYWGLIATAFMVANTLVAMGKDILNVDLNFLILLGWFTLASLLVNEVRSILENFVELGYKVPEFLVKGLAVTDLLINKGIDIPGKEENDNE